mgnify:CR=1 FL=1
MKKMIAAIKYWFISRHEKEDILKCWYTDQEVIDNRE